MRFSYPLFGDISCYADCSNARQKVRLVGETLKGVVFIPQGRRDLIPSEATEACFEEVQVPRNIVELVRFLRVRRGRLSGFGVAVSNEKTLLKSIVLSVFSGVPIVLFCWDPPGVSVQNRKDIFSRFRVRVMDVLMALAVRCSVGMILNLHPGFLEGRFSEEVKRKVFVFPNGTTIEKNLSYEVLAKPQQSQSRSDWHPLECGVIKGCVSLRETRIGGFASASYERRVPKRFVVACRVNEQKGCWDVANYFIKLHRQDQEVSLVWVGGGQDREVYRYLLENGVPADNLVMPGDLQRDEALKYIATASFAINMYPDVPSLRWNYVLKAPEFLSFGLPIVTNDLPGIGEYAKDGETGIVFRSGDLDHAVEKTLAVLKDPALYEKMSAAARERAQRYDWKLINKDIAAKIIELTGVSA